MIIYQLSYGYLRPVHLRSGQWLSQDFSVFRFGCGDTLYNKQMHFKYGLKETAYHFCVSFCYLFVRRTDATHIMLKIFYGFPAFIKAKMLFFKVRSSVDIDLVILHKPIFPRCYASLLDIDASHFIASFLFLHLCKTG